MGRRIVLENIGIPGISTFEVFKRTGGYRAVEKALKEYSPENVISEVKISGLRGRGGAGFPTGLKWNFIDQKSEKPKYMVCNADESEPGTFKDRYIMERIPHRLIEGIIISSYAIRASVAYIYIRGEFRYIIGILNRAIREAYNSGFLGKNILGSGYDLDIFIHPGAGAYICGEETALLESLEGKRGNPRIKPPFPASKGLWGCPTVVNNVETLAAVGPVINMTGAEYASIGTGKSTGTKLFSVCGHARRPGIYEVELGIPVEEFIYSDEYCGGVKDGKDLKAVIPGGTSVNILPSHLMIKTAAGKTRYMTYESLAEGGAETGTMLGSGGFIVYDEDDCIVRNTWNLERFYRHESCGQCSPCREGTGWMESVLYRVEHGSGRMRDLDLLVSVASKVEGTTICPLGDAAAWPVESALRHFRDEFEFHVKNPSVVMNTEHGSLKKYDTALITSRDG